MTLINGPVTFGHSRESIEPSEATSIAQLRRKIPAAFPKSVTCHRPSRAVWYTARYMAAKKTTPKELGEMLGYVVKHMATKDDLAAVEARLDKRIDKLEHRLDRVEAKIDRLDTKLSKFEESEIDKRMQLEVRVAAIEKHLGLNKKIAA